MKALSLLAIILAAFSGIAAAARTKNREWPEAVYYANAYADHYGVSRSLVHAVIEQESNWDPDAVSTKGALGIMQLMPETAREYGARDPFSIAENIGAGTRYLADLVHEFHGDFRLATAAYYCGNHPIQRRGLKYRNADVFQYVSSVRKFYLQDTLRHKNHETHPTNRKAINP